MGLEMFHSNRKFTHQELLDSQIDGREEVLLAEGFKQRVGSDGRI